MIEYAVLLAVTTALCIFLYYPHNGLYEAMRESFDGTMQTLMVP